MEKRFYEEPARMVALQAEISKIGFSDRLPVDKGNVNDESCNFQARIANGRRAINEMQERASSLMAQDKIQDAEKVVDSIATLGSLMNEWERGIEAQKRVSAANAELQANGGVPPAFRGDATYNPQTWSPTPTAAKSTDTVKALTKDEKFASQYSKKYNFGFGDYIAGMVGASNRADVKAALSEGTDSSGGYSVPSELLAEVIDDMRAATVCIQAGARTVPLTTDQTRMLKIVKDPTPTWRAENSLVSESEPNFGAIEFKPRSLAVMVRASRELLEDSTNIDTAIRLAFAASMAQALDRAALFGTGQDNEPLGLLNHNIPTIDMGADGGSFTDYSPLLDLIELYENNDNWDMNGRVMVMNPTVKRQLAGLVNSENDPLRQPEELYQIPRLTTTNMPTNEVQGSATNASSVILGEFSKMLIGMRNSMRIEVLREQFADHMQYGFLCWMRADVALMHERSFARLAGITPKASTVSAKRK